MLWVIPLGLGAAYLLFGKKKEEEPSSEEEAAPMQTQAPMRQTLTAEQARALGFAAPAPTPKAPYMVQAAKRARVQDKMTMRARVGPAEPLAVKAAREAAEAAQKLGTPFGWKPGTGSATPSNPADGIAAFDASASFDLTTKLK